jgi:beta-1,4-mannosyl-glycoprotein beta-1,4-N-acetylglucosaminyltransferase
MILRLEPTQLDMNAPDRERDLCSQHNWRPFITNHRQPSRKVYDLFMVNTELDWLEIRLNTTYEYMDYFIVVESPKTFTNRDKPLIVEEKLEKFTAHADKIIYHQLEIPEGFLSNQSNPAWVWEGLQRNMMYDKVFARLQGKQAPVQGEVIIVADVDEILRPKTVIILKACSFPLRRSQDMSKILLDR